MDSMLYVGMIFLFGGIVLVLWTFLGGPKKVRFRLPDEALVYKKRKGYPFLSHLSPFLHKFMEKSGLDMRYKRRIDAAHVDISPVEFFNLKLFLMKSPPALMTIYPKPRAWRTK